MVAGELVFFAKKSVIARELVLEMDSLAIATFGLEDDSTIARAPAFENPPFDLLSMTMLANSRCEKMFYCVWNYVEIAGAKLWKSTGEKLLGNWTGLREKLLGNWTGLKLFRGHFRALSGHTFRCTFRCAFRFRNYKTFPGNLVLQRCHPKIS